MPHRCCVPNCKSNSSKEKEYISTFFFLKDPARKALWCKHIPRKNFEPTATTSICIKHFHSKFFHKGNKNQSRVRLNKVAYPSIFPDLPKYLSSTPPSNIQDPQRSVDRMKDYDESVIKDWKEKDIINNID